MRTEALGPLLSALQVQLSPLDISGLAPERLRGELGALLGLRTGASLAFDRAAGLLVDEVSLASGTPRAIGWVTTLSPEAVASDFPASRPVAPFVVVAVPGGYLLAPDEATLAALRNAAIIELARAPSATGGPGVTLHAPIAAAPAALAGAIAGAGTNGAGYLERWLTTVESADGTFVPDGDRLAVTLDLRPIAGASLALPTSLAPDGAALPMDLPVQATFSLPPSFAQTLASSVIGPLAPSDKSTMDVLAKLLDGTGSVALEAGLETTGTELVLTLGVTSETMARAALQTLVPAIIRRACSPACPPPASLWTMPSADAQTLYMKDATKVNGVPVDRLDGYAPRRSVPGPFGARFTAYLAYPPKTCVIVIAPTEPIARRRLVMAIVGVTKSIAPLLRHPGVAATAALVEPSGGSDGSHGLLYVDLGRELRQSLAFFRTTRSTETVRPSGKPGLGVSWGTTGNGLRVTAAVSVDSLRAIFAPREPRPMPRR